MAWELTASQSRAARAAGSAVIDRRLLHHLVVWLGRWPAGGRLDVVGSTRRSVPAWDGEVQPLRGVVAPEGGVLSVAPEQVEAVRELVTLSLDEMMHGLPMALGHPDRVVYQAVFRWSTEPGDLPDAGVWLPADDPTLPEWLRPFGSEVLAALDPDTGEFLAGVGIKRHDAYGREIAVGTTESARGRGLARALVAQAARRVLDEGAIPTYLHDRANVASARVADAAGFADRGWIALASARPERLAS